MCAFHSRAGRNAESPRSSNGVHKINGSAKNGTEPANGVQKNAVQKTRGVASNGKVYSFPIPAPSSLLPLVHEERIRKVLQVIEARPRCTIGELALEFKLSHSHLQHLVKEQTGIGLGHLLAEQRLCRAAQLLSSSDLSVKEIADTVGYEHASSFIRAFERRFTTPPRVYRKQHGPK